MDVQKQKMYEMRTETSVDNSKLSALWNKFENCVKDDNFFIKGNIAFLSWARIYFILGDMFLEDS